MFTYKSNGQPDAFGFLPAGVYPAIVIKAEEKTSKSGNPMLVVSLKAMDKNGESTTVQEYLASTEKSIWKIDNFMWAIGICPQAGQTVSIMPNQIIGKSCYVRVGVEKGESRDFNNCLEVMSVEEGRVIEQQKYATSQQMSKTGDAEDKSGSGWKGNSFYPEEAAKARRQVKQDEFENLEDADDVPF